MNKIRNLISVLVGLAVLGGLVLGLTWLLGPQGARPAQQSLPTQQVSPLQTPIPYEPPTPTSGPWIWADQTPTPWLTPTPLPQPTRRPGPTETPLPLVQSAQSAAGEIIYVDVISSREEARGSGGIILGKTLAISALAMDEAGVAQRTAAQLTGAIEPNFEWGAVYPAPDGRRLAVEGDWGAVKILDLTTGSLEWPALPAGGGGAGGFLGWHPDSRQILYRNDAGYDAGLVLVDTKHCILLVREANPGAISDGAVSPDGTKVVYSFYRGGDTGELRMIGVDSGEQRVLATCGDFYMISWSPDGGKIGFFGCGGYTLMNTDGDVLGVLKLYTPEYPSEPLWSPDGRLLLYASSTRGKLDPYDPFRQAVVHVVDVTTEEEILTLEEATDPAWSPDGAQIAFISARSGTPQVWAVNLDGSNLRQLTSGDQPARFPFWRRTQRP
jgi:Tol biopolymer transport system component